MKQLSVFLNDRPGELANFIELLMENKIFIRALTVAQTSEYGLLLLLVDKLEKCLALLEEKKYTHSTTDVIAVKLNGHPKALYEIPKSLGDNDVNIDYCYSTLVKEDPMLILRVANDDIKKATQTLVKSRFTIFET
ncbi:MAG: hypothetical protein Lokiarch_44140 [Candidatus Lokiarchaeum sp. GC14_75]|nr:MAG: hypothetical protein Lokiarch_44140 [Candidatus Lokiarchaeum sp. GC14_75]